jgi:hypothetical protein
MKFVRTRQAKAHEHNHTPREKRPLFSFLHTVYWATKPPAVQVYVLHAAGLVKQTSEFRLPVPSNCPTTVEPIGHGLIDVVAIFTVAAQVFSATPWVTVPSHVTVTGMPICPTSPEGHVP